MNTDTTRVAAVTALRGLSRRSRIVGVAGAVVAAASLLTTGVTAAAPLDHGEFHHEFGFTVTDFCEVSGLTVQIDGVVDGRFLATPQGDDRLVHFMDHLHVSRVLTNVGTGDSISDDERTVVKDLRVVDNGDGTLTITVLATGNMVAYDADGKAIARNPGQSRFQFIVDHGGTPADPSDDVELDDLGLIKGSTGRSDDYCTAAVAALT
jgi:hypothetical protein